MIADQMDPHREGASDGPTRRLEQRLQEAFDDLYAGFVDPREAYADETDGASWLGLAVGGGTKNAAGPGFSNEQELAALRSECRSLALKNEFAINGHENRVSYIIGSGHNYRAAARRHGADPCALAEQVQRVLDEFLRVNRWQQRQQEAALRLDRDGEVFLRFFVGAGGMTLVRFVEPGQVCAPSDALRDASLSYGIVTDVDDVEAVQAYYVDGVPVDAAEIQHRKANVDANVKRGLPLFYPVRKNLRRAEKLLRNMSTVAEIQSAIALIRKHRSATRTAVQQFVSSRNEASGGEAANGRFGSVRRFAPGTILDAYGNVDYDFPAAALDASSYVAVLQAELRAIAARLVMPEFMLTSDASNGNYASTLVAESPALRMFQRLQARQIADDREVMLRVIDNAVRAGRLEPCVHEEVVLQIEAPSLAMRDAKSEAERFAIEYANGILSPQTWSLKSGLDYDREQANLREYRRGENATET
jgi:capsid protein